MKRSLSGIKPTGMPHLGNILGMILPAIEMQETHETFYFIADYHALTTVRDAALLKEDTYNVAAVWLALGLDPKKACLFKQSDIPQVSELMWILSTVTSMGDLTRAHAYKAAKDKGQEGALNLGTFAYPVLMAADIILYDSDVVPVGKDQIQHVEMARAMAQRFNHYFGETLKEPQELINDSVATVPGIDGQKMSKSYNNGIEPLIAPKKLKKQVMNIVTDSKELEDVKDPSNCHIVDLFKLVASADEIAEMEAHYRKGGYGYGHAKLALLEKLEERFAPARERYNELMSHKTEIDEALNMGAQRARQVAQEVLVRTRKACGLQ